MLINFLRDEDGATVVELAVLAGLLAVIAVVAIVVILGIACMVSFLVS